MQSPPLIQWKGIQIVTDPTWGDNGKGKIVDVLGPLADMVIRYAGGPNAGHTVKNNRGEFKFHVIPSGICNPKTLCVLAEGVVINPLLLVSEITTLRAQGIAVTPQNLLIAAHAHAILPWHRVRDGLSEVARGGKSIGTTKHGIGPAYADKTERVGLRMADVCSPNFEELFEKELRWQQKLIALMQKEEGTDEMLRYVNEFRQNRSRIQKILRPLVGPTLETIWRYADSGKRIIGEGAQGALLDIDLGNYPYVTSSHPGLNGFSIATGIDPRQVRRVIGVTKAYATRVGGGPMPTELTDTTGDLLRTAGHEFGTTTGRPRRCGWLDVPAIRYGCRIAGVTSLALTKLDILDSFTQIKICTTYRYKGKTYTTLPTADPDFMDRAKPIYEIHKGWEQQTSSVRSFEKLPGHAKTYVKRIEKLVGLPIEIVSVGPSREATIFV